VSARSTIRWRLTAFYGFLFFLCGLVLLTVSYVVVRASLIDDENKDENQSAELYGLDPVGVRRFLDIPLPEPVESQTGERAETVGDVINGVQRNNRENALDDLLRGTGAALGVMVLLSVLVGWLAAGRVLRPVKQLTLAAQDLSETNLDRRIDLEGPEDELKELADTLDALLARLEVAFVSQRRFAADVSHELRTPLSIIRGEADVTLADPNATAKELRLALAVSDAVVRAEALIDSLLALARSDSTMHERKAVDLAELTGDVVGERVEAASSAGVEIDLDLGSATVEGDRWLLERLVANLVDNGINHNAPHGWVRVAIDAQNGSTHLEVSNSGDVLTADDVEEITKPFRRLDHRAAPQSEGFGLGMTIVQAVADAHNGQVDIDARSTGGLDVVVTLPTAKNAAIASRS
jgi:signal transduction histidine kinase